MSKRAFRKKKIHVVANENAGRAMGRKQERDVIIAMLEEAFPNARHSAADLTLHRTHSLNELDVAKDEMRKDGPDIIAIFGGDGTIQKALGQEDGFLEDLLSGPTRPQFLFYGGGSTDVIKGELKVLGRDSVKATQAIIKKITRGEQSPDVIHRYCLDINGRKGFIYGSGLAAALLQKYNAKSPKGFRRLLAVGGWMFFNETFRFLPPWQRTSVARRLPVSHQYWSDDRMLMSGVGNRSGVIASSLSQVGMGCKVTSRAFEDVAHFHCIISGLGFWRTILNLPSMFAGTALIGDVVDGIATKVVLEYGEPVMHTIDGELYTPEEMTERVVIERGPLLDIIRS